MASASLDATLLALLSSPPGPPSTSQRAQAKASAATLPPPPFSPSTFLDLALPSSSAPSTALRLSSLSSLLPSLQGHARQLRSSQAVLLNSALPLLGSHSAQLASQTATFTSLTSSYSTLRHSLTSDLSSLSPLTSALSTLLTSTASIQRVHVYLQLHAQCEELAELARTQATPFPLLAAKALLQLSRLYAQLRREAASSGARVAELERLLHRRLLHLLHSTRQRLLSAYADCLAQLRWPQTGQRLLDTANEAAMSSFTQLTETLLLLQIETEIGTDAHTAAHADAALPAAFSSPSPPAPPPPLWVLELLFSPLHLRFHYHFTSERPTNRVDKPEWFLSFIAHALTVHSPFLSRYVQPLLLRSPLPPINPSFALLSSLLTLTRSHITSLLPTLMPRPVLFRHLIDELLAFEGRLRQGGLGLEYPEECEGVVGVLVGEGREAVFERWLSVDKEWVNDRLGAMRDMTHPWARLSEGGEPDAVAMGAADDVDSDDEDVGELQLDTEEAAADADEEEAAPTAAAEVDAAAPTQLVVTRSAHLLVSLVSSITSRFTLLPSLSARLRFVQDLQYQLLDIYLEWLEEEGARLLPSVQSSIANPSSAVRVYCMVVNSLHYVESVLVDWSDEVTFIELRYYQAHSELPADLTVAQLVERIAQTQREGGGGEVEGSVFDAMIANYADAREKMVKGIVDAVLDCFDALSRTYRRLGHQHFVGDNDPLASPLLPAAPAPRLRVETPAPSVSASFVPPLLTLKLQLLHLSRHLSFPLFALFWQRVAARLDLFLFSTTLAERYFSPFGAAQLCTDLHALLLLFRPYTAVPGRWLSCLSDACTVLGYGGQEREEMEREMSGVQRLHWIEKGEEERRRSWRERWRIRRLTEAEVQGILQRTRGDAQPQLRAHDRSMQAGEADEEEEREGQEEKTDSRSVPSAAVDVVLPPQTSASLAAVNQPAKSLAQSAVDVGGDDEAGTADAALGIAKRDSATEAEGNDPSSSHASAAVLARLAAEAGVDADQEMEAGDGWDVDL